MPIKSSTLHKKVAEIKKEIKKSDPNAKLIARIEKLEESNKLTSSKVMEIVVKVNKISHRLGL
tara:strand:+ start:1872 stop:2060 length:189 start_codon:yes stop_codon:yes gene_type:complete